MGWKYWNNKEIRQWSVMLLPDLGDNWRESTNQQMFGPRKYVCYGRIKKNQFRNIFVTKYRNIKILFWFFIKLQIFY